MSRDPYRGSAPDLGYAPRPQRWDADRLAFERDSRDRYEERETRITTRPQPRERSVDFIDERRSSRGGAYEEERVREREYDYGPPPEERYAIPVRTRKQSVTIEREREREYYEEPPRRAPMPRPGLLRRQSSLDTFDRKPYFPREEYGPPARRADYRPEPIYAPPLPRSRQLGPPRGYRERDFEEIRVAEPDYYGDEEYRPFPERIREREVIRRRRGSRSKESHVRSNSSSSSGTSVSTAVRPEFPKRGKTRMPARLVSIKAVIDLGYPYEQEGETIVIQKALGRENIDEVIKLSEDYKTTAAPEIIEMSGARSSAGEIVEERREFTHTDTPGVHQTFEKTTIERREVSPARTTISRSRSVGRSPVIIDAIPTYVTEHETSAPMIVGPLVLADSGHNHRKDERAIRAEIKALEAEKEALRAERRASRELRRADRIRREGRESGEMVLYEETTTRVREPEGGVRIEKDKKGPDPKAIRMLMKTLT